MAGSKGFPRLVAHIKRLHLSSDDRRGALREALSTDCELFVSVGEALKALYQWLCGGVRREVVPLGGVVVDEVLLDRVFSLPITTVKSIPHSCRMAFSHALAAALGKVAATPTSGNRKSLQCHSIQRVLAAWCGDGFIELIPFLFVQPLRVVSGKDDHVSGSDRSTVGTNVKQCLRKVSNGHFTAAVKVLCSSEVAPFGTDTLTALLAKHPILPPLVMHGSLPLEPPLFVDVDSILGCIQSLLKGTSCGRDGLRAQHILDALYGEGSAIAVGLLKAISVVVNLLLEGRCPKVLAEFVASAPLTPLLKPDNGIRPIAFGVGSPSGAEAVLHGANRFLNKFHSDGSLAMLTVDFSNAFNLVDRTTLLHEVRTRCPSISLWVDFLYGQSARLYVGDDHIWSTTGVQQGDPLGPLLFALDAPTWHRAPPGLELNIKKTEGVLAICQWGEGCRREGDRGYCGLWGSFFGDFQWRLASLPIRFGGLGLCSAEDVSTYAFVASRAQSWSLQDHILQGCGIDGADSDYGYALDRVRMSLPEFDLSGQHMSALEYRTVSLRTANDPLFPVDSLAPVAAKDCLDSFGEQAVHCKDYAGFKYRHDLVGNYPLEGRSTLRPSNIHVFEWVGGKHACVDLTGVSPLVGLRDNGFVAGQAALKAESCKNPDVNLLKEDVSNVPVWVKLYDVPLTAFCEDGLSAIATKLDQAMPKLDGKGFYTCDVRVKYEWKPPRCACCNVFGHVQDECYKNIDSDEVKNMKKPSQTPIGVSVGPKMGFKPVKVYRQVSKKTNVNNNGTKKKDIEPTIESLESSNTSTTPIIEKNDKKRLIIEGKVSLVDDEGKPLTKVDSLGNHDSEDEVASVDNDIVNFRASKKVGYGQDILEKIQDICDNLDIKVRGRKKI
ncbi:hypothetical protein Tco_0687032 [Tanacetum coccineum]